MNLTRDRISDYMTDMYSVNRFIDTLKTPPYDYTTLNDIRNNTLITVTNSLRFRAEINGQILKRILTGTQ